MDWSKFQTTKFKPSIKDPKFSPRGTCGVAALAYLTGISQRTIDKKTPKRAWWSDRQLIQYLKAHGFQVVPITPERNYKSKEMNLSMNYYERSLNHLNVILLSQHTMRTEGTWAVAYNHRYYHGEEIEFFSGYELVGNPLWTAYVIWHRSWETGPKERLRALRDLVGVASRLKKKVDVFQPYSGEWTHGKR